MTSSIGMATQATPFNPQVFPHDVMDGSTSGIGGMSSVSYGRYDAEPTHNFRYVPGSLKFRIPGKGRQHGPKGTWGRAIVQKVNPRKQVSGTSGYLDQNPRGRPNRTQMVLANVGRVVQDRFIPRGGNVMRVIATQGDDGDNSIFFNVDPELKNANVRQQPGDVSMDRRNINFVPGAEEPKNIDASDNVIRIGAGANVGKHFF